MKNFNLRPVLGRGNTSVVRADETFNPGVYATTMNVFNMQELHNSLIPPLTGNQRRAEQSFGISNDMDMRNKNELASGITAILFKQLPDNAGVEFTHQGGISNAQFQGKNTVSTMSPVSVREPPCPVFPTGVHYSPYCSLSSVSVSSHSTDHSIGHLSPVNMGEDWMDNNTRRVQQSRKPQSNVNMKTVNDNTQWLYCELCDCCVNSDYQMRIHNDGKKHQKKVEMTQRHPVRSHFTPSTARLAETTEILPAVQVTPTIDTWSDPQHVNSWIRSIPTSHESQPNIQWCYQPNTPPRLAQGEAHRRDDSDYSSANSDTDSTGSW